MVDTNNFESYKENNEEKSYGKMDLSEVKEIIYANKKGERGAYYEIVTRVAYLIGVDDRIFENENYNYDLKIYNSMKITKNARIIRNLCRLRNALESKFLKICMAMQQDNKSLIAMPEYIPLECMEELSNDNVDIYKNLSNDIKSPSPFLFMINNEIKSRINNCRDLFPEWLNWKYLSDLFIMPEGDTDEGTKKEGKKYYDNWDFYPFQKYINWEPRDCGNLLYNDRHFVKILYEMNMDEFRDMSLVSDVSERTKSNIYSFIEDSDKTIFVVDCENSDPYALCAAIKNLDKERLEKVEKIILYDDIHAASAWEMLGGYIDLPVEYIMIERLKDNKSLTDIKVASRITQEFCNKNADSFVIVSSDSDYWGLIEELPKARFFIMIEHTKSSYALKEVLINNDIYYCYIDDFYVGDGNEIKTDAINRELARAFKDALDINLDELMNEILIRTRINMTDAERESFIKKQIKKNLNLEIDDDNNMYIEYRRKK